MEVFQPANILIPDMENLSDWAVVACDQYSSQPDYWQRVEETVKDSPSALHLVLPEAWLGTQKAQDHQEKIHATMDHYLSHKIFKEYPDSFIYVERKLKNGSIRRGLVGSLDLEAYDYRKGSKSLVRATEATIIERIPPRVKIRMGASLELPHVLLLADDEQDVLLEPIEQSKEELPIAYDFDLMEDGGHITGWVVTGPDAQAFTDRLNSYTDALPYKYPDLEDSMLFAVGDGNHSLATAKSIWEALKPSLTKEEQQTHPARFALVELENIHDKSQVFEPIHRILADVKPDEVLTYVKEHAETGSGAGYEITWLTESGEGKLLLDPALGELPLGILQSALDSFLNTEPGKIDYIHGEDVVRSLSQQKDTIGFIVPPIEKNGLFRSVIVDGSLPRKSFSMGHACEKRYYLEAKKIQ